MNEVQIVRKRTHVWPVVIALIVLALVIAFAFFAMNGGVNPDVGWNGTIEWGSPAAGEIYGIA